MDILSRIAVPTKVTTKLVKRWVVMVGGRTGRKLYTHARVQRLVTRAKRFGVDCYAAPMMVRI